MADYLSVAGSAASAVSAVGAVVLWSIQSARKPKPESDEGPASRLTPTGFEVGGLVLVVAAAALLVVRAITTTLEDLEQLSMLLLVGAVLLRGYRLARAGSPTLGRLASALALVPGLGLMIGGLGIAVVTRSHDTEVATYVATGAAALGGALLWLRRPARTAG